MASEMGLSIIKTVEDESCHNVLTPFSSIISQADLGQRNIEEYQMSFEGYLPRMEKSSEQQRA